jgi:hypothetical protein
MEHKMSEGTSRRPSPDVKGVGEMTVRGQAEDFGCGWMASEMLLEREKEYRKQVPRVDTIMFAHGVPLDGALEKIAVRAEYVSWCINIRMREGISPLVVNSCAALLGTRVDEETAS